MADELSIALLDLPREADPAERTDFVRQAVERLAQAIVEVERKVWRCRSFWSERCVEP
jgi:HEPN domain-containing protein